MKVLLILLSYAQGNIFHLEMNSGNVCTKHSYEFTNAVSLETPLLSSFLAGKCGNIVETILPNHTCSRQTETEFDNYQSLLTLPIALVTLSIVLVTLTRDCPMLNSGPNIGPYPSEN